MKHARIPVLAAKPGEPRRRSKWPFPKWFLAAVVLLAVVGTSWSFAEGKEMSESPFPKRVKVPPFPQMEWINTAGPIELNDLRGKFVLLDFWTYCCINCMHILPELKKLEKAYPDNLVVIGVHSAKFETEQDPKNIKEAVLRYQIEHPVINDANHVLWNRFGVNAWPTVILIDPEGYAVWGTSGEITFDQVDRVLKGALRHYQKKGLLDTRPVRFDLEMHRTEATPLRFPGKVLADEASGRLFIADSNHNRIVVAGFDGSLVATIGSGESGRADGDFATAQFNQPQGMALRGQTLYVADTENHLIRKVDLEAKRVETVAGLGHQGREMPPLGRMMDPMKTALNSPWDLALHDESLFIAMAGWHQIWRMRLDRPAIGVYAGNGREDIVDGPPLPKHPYELGFASFAQPSGLASDGTWLYVADSEGSSIRAVPLEPRKGVRTVVGTSHLPAARLFTFGDVDGPAPAARFQHPLGVAWYQDRLLVADTYNNKIRVVDPKSGAAQTLAGTRQPGRQDNPAQFDEPAGLSAAGGKLYVADTNNHLIRVVNLSDKTVSTLTIRGLQFPKPPAETGTFASLAGAIQESLEPVAVRAESGTIRLAVRLQLPEGYKINPLAPMSYRVAPAQGNGKAAAQPGLVRRESLGKPVRLEKPAAEFEIPVPVAAAAGQETLNVAVNYFYCREGAEGLCKTGTVVWTVPVQVSTGAAASAVPLRHEIRP